MLAVGDNLANYSLQYWPTYPYSWPAYPRHPGCPGRVHICPDCGQQYHDYPYSPGITWDSTGTTSIPGTIQVGAPARDGASGTVAAAHACI